MAVFDTRDARAKPNDLREQARNKVDLDKDGKLNAEERKAFNETLKELKELRKSVQQESQKTSEGYQRSTYGRPEKDLQPDEKQHGYAPSSAEKRFTGRDANIPPKAEADVKFRFDRADLTPEAQRAVADVAAEIHRIKRENGGVIPEGTKITVHGHTDSMGAASYNQSLSERRAQTAKDAIVEATGIKPEMIQVVGHGENEPIADNKTREGRALNRRVEIGLQAPEIEKRPNPETKPETKPDPRPQTGSVEMKPEAKPETRPEAKPQPKPDPKPQPGKVEMKPEAKQETKPEVKPEAKPDPTALIASTLKSLPPNPSVVQTREWTDRNMKLYNGLDEAGKKTFTETIQREYQFREGAKQFNPEIFFNRKIAEAAVTEINGATLTRIEHYAPLTTSRMMPPLQTRVVSEIDPIKVHAVIRSVSDLPRVLPHIAIHPDVIAIREKLPKEGIFFKEDGIHQQALDARLSGNTVEAEALLLRSLIESGDMRDAGRRKRVIVEALGSNKTQSDQIREFYKKTFDTDLVTDIRKANGGKPIDE